MGLLTAGSQSRRRRKTRQKRERPLGWGGLPCTSFDKKKLAAIVMVWLMDFATRSGAGCIEP